MYRAGEERKKGRHLPDATRERRRERERVGGRGRGMSMSVVIHMATYLRPRHVLGILIGSQKQETFLSLPFFRSPITVCYVQPSREAEGSAEGAERVQGTGDWDRSCSHCPFVACFSAHFGLFFFFSPSASSPRGQLRLDESTPSEATRSRGHAHVRIVGRTPENLSVAKATTVRQAASSRQAGSIPSCCMQIFPAHTAKLCCQSPLHLPPLPLHSPLNHALVLRHCLSSLLAYFAYFAIQFLFFICAFFQPSLSLSSSLTAL